MGMCCWPNWQCHYSRRRTPIRTSLMQGRFAHAWCRCRSGLLTAVITGLEGGLATLQPVKVTDSSCCGLHEYRLPLTFPDAEPRGARLFLRRQEVRRRVRCRAGTAARENKLGQVLASQSAPVHFATCLFTHHLPPTQEARELQRHAPALA